MSHILFNQFFRILLYLSFLYLIVLLFLKRMSLPIVGSGVVLTQYASVMDTLVFSSFQVILVETVSHNTNRIRFKLNDHVALHYPVSSAVDVRLPGNDWNDEIVSKRYTPITHRLQKGYFDLLVKGYPQGVVSKYLVELKIGDQVQMRGPLLKIGYELGKYDHIGMIAGGTGIAPMIQLCQEILGNDKDETKISLLFGNVEEKDILMRELLDEWAQKYAQFSVHYVLDHPPPHWNGSVGYINEDIAKKFLPSPLSNSFIYISGPPGMIAAVAGKKEKVNGKKTQGDVNGILKNLGFTNAQVYKF